MQSVEPSKKVTINSHLLIHLPPACPLRLLRLIGILAEALKTNAQPTTPKTRKRGRTAVDASDSTPVAKQHLSLREGGDIDLGILDQEAFARVIASGQQYAIPPAEPIEPEAKEVVEQYEEEGAEITDDVTYRSSGIPDGSGPICSLRMTCLPVLDILVFTNPRTPK